MVMVHVGWALHGKPAGSHEDYTIMASGGTDFTVGDWMMILSRFSLGNPPADRCSPGSLPWTAISQLKDGTTGCLGLTIHEWSPDLDGAGRPIARSRYFTLPYQELCGQAVSYRDLYAALRRAPLPENGAAMQVDLATTDVAEQVRSIARFGFERVATAAAMSLEGQVTVTRCPEPAMEQRLAFLDAVAALLPYGWRNAYSAATWHEGGSKHVKLAFSRHNRPDSFELDWFAPAEPPYGADIAGTYLERLRELTGGGGEDGAVSRVIDHLRKMTDPVREPQEAVWMLGELDWPWRVLKAAQQGRALPADLRRMFATGRWRELESAEDRATVFSELIGCADDHDLPVIVQHWPAVAAGQRQPFDRLVRVGRAAIWSLESGRDVAAYFSAADTLGLGDPYTAAVIERSGAETETRSPAFAAACLKQRLGSDRRQTFEALLRDIPLVFALIMEVSDQRQDLLTLVARLKERLPAPMRPIEAILGDEARPIGEHDMAQLAVYGVSCLYDYLRLAAASGRLPVVLPSFAGWLAGGPPADATFWSTRLAGLDHVGVAEQGMIDALLLSMASRPRYLRLTAREDGAAYRDGFLQVLRLSATDSRERALTGLAEELRSWRWAVEPEAAATVLSLSAVISRDGGAAAELLLHAVVAGRAVNANLSENAEYDDWWRQAVRACPELRRKAPLIALLALPREADPRHVAILCAEGYQVNLSAQQTYAHLSRSQWKPDSEAVLRLLVETRRRGLTRPAAPAEVDRWMYAFFSAFIEEGGTPHPAELRTYTAHHVLREIDFQLGLLERVLSAGDEQDAHLLSEDARTRLDEITQRTRDLAAEGKGHRRWFR